MMLLCYSRNTEEKINIFGDMLRCAFQCIYEPVKEEQAQYNIQCYAVCSFVVKQNVSDGNLSSVR